MSHVKGESIWCAQLGPDRILEAQRTLQTLKNEGDFDIDRCLLNIRGSFWNVCRSLLNKRRSLLNICRIFCLIWNRHSTRCRLLNTEVALASLSWQRGRLRYWLVSFEHIYLCCVLQWKRPTFIQKRPTYIQKRPTYVQKRPVLVTRDKSFLKTSIFSVCCSESQSDRDPTPLPTGGKRYPSVAVCCSVLQCVVLCCKTHHP